MTTLGTFKSTRNLEYEVLQVLRSGRLTYGPVSASYEKEFASIHDCKDGIVSNSGTSALQVAIQAMAELYHWDAGSEIIVPSTTFVATVNAVIHCGFKPVLVDVDPDYYCIDPALIDDAITPRTCAIIPVHAFGHPADMKAICSIARQYNLKVIEDTCECMYVSTDDRTVGSWGDAAAFSTYAAHIISTGVGGMTTVREDEELAKIIRSLVNHGIDTKELPTGERVDASWIQRQFNFTRIGHSFRITEIEAAMGLLALQNLHINIDARQSNAAKLTDELCDIERIQLPAIRPQSDHSWMVYPIVALDENKHGIMAHLRGVGIECRDLLPLTTQPCYSFKPEDFPVSDKLNKNGFYIGCHQDFTQGDISKISEAIHEYFE